jgi:dTDP-4-dehydrorhamnose reductase
MKVLIFGGTGLLGYDIKQVCKNEHTVIALSSQDCDIRNPQAPYNKIEMEKPDIVINCAAITDVDKCEQMPDEAYRVNALGVKNIAIACRDFNVKLIHISTDYVFDGAKKEPYTEFDTPNPVNTYGKTKLAGEEFVKMLLSNFIIIRTAWIFGENRKHFVDYVVNGIKNGNEIIAVRDMVSSPTYSYDLAETINKLLPLNQSGIFHIANKGYCSRVEMVEEIIRIMKKQANVKVVNQSQWERPAKRPVFSALKNYHLFLLGIDNMPGWRDALKRYIRFKFES